MEKAVVLGPVMNKAHTKTSTVFMREVCCSLSCSLSLSLSLSHAVIVEAVYNNKVLPYS